MDRKKAWATVPMARARKKRSHHVRTAPPMGKPGAIQPRMARGATARPIKRPCMTIRSTTTRKARAPTTRSTMPAWDGSASAAKRREPPTSPAATALTP